MDALGHLPIGIVSVDVDGRVQRANAAAERLLSVPLDQVVLPIALPGDTELDIDDRVIRARATATPDGYVVVLDDITDTLLELESLRQREAEAWRESELKGAFLANMSHEVRTPLNGVLGMAELLLATDLDPTQREYVETARESGQSLLHLLNAVLDYAKLEAGRMTVEWTEFDLRAVVQRMARPHHARSAIPLDVRIDEAIPSRLQGDPIRLGQVLGNLVDNALKFTTAGQVDLTVEQVRELPDGVLLRFEVQDTGIGISAAAMARLFEPFSQGDSSTTRRFGGSGLGLAICRQLVDLMGGTLEATSSPGQGARFWFSIPLRRGGIAQPTSSGSAMLRRVLVAEDNAVNRLVAARLLEQLGCQVVVVEDGQRAVERVRAGDIDLVLMDCQMPRMDGFAAARAMRAEGHRGPIVAVTASDVQDDRRQIVASGMDAVLPKPLALAALRAVVLQMLPDD